MKQSLHSLLRYKVWDGAYYELLNSPNAKSCRYTRERKPLLLKLVDSEAPPKLVDLAASLFPEDIIGRRALHSAITSPYRMPIIRSNNPKPDTRTEIVKILLQNWREYLGGDNAKLEQSLSMGCRFRNSACAPTALHLACQDPTCDLEMLKHLVEACPKALLQRSNRLRPSQLFYRRIQRTANTNDVAVVWEKLEYLAVATYLASSTTCSVEFASEKKKFLLHALVGDSDQISIQILGAVIGRCGKPCAFAKDAKGCIPLHRILRNVKPELWGNNVEELLRLAPETAKIPTPHGRYPLHLALSTSHVSTLSWEKGLGSVVEAYSPALAIKGKKGLYPFQLAATKNAPVDIIYRLLRAQPELVLRPRRSYHEDQEVNQG